jgi:hypothetical protein
MKKGGAMPPKKTAAEESATARMNLVRGTLHIPHKNMLGAMQRHRTSHGAVHRVAESRAMVVVRSDISEAPI